MQYSYTKTIMKVACVWNCDVSVVKRKVMCVSGNCAKKVDSSWNVMAHGDAGRSSEGQTGEWSG